MKIVEVALCIVLGLIFMTSSVPKLRHPKGFVLTVLEYRILPPSLSYFYGWLLPPLELLLALLLLMGTMIHIVAIVTALLFISFIVAISINVVRGRDLDCHCFGTKLQSKIGWPLVLQDILFLGIALVVAFLTSAQSLLESWSLFSIIGFGSGNYARFFALLFSLGMTGCITFLLRTSKSRSNRSSRAKYISRIETGTGKNHL